MGMQKKQKQYIQACWDEIEPSGHRSRYNRKKKKKADMASPLEIVIVLIVLLCLLLIALKPLWEDLVLLGI